MKATLEALGAEIDSALDACRSEEDLERARITFLGRKGRLTDATQGVGALAPEVRPAIRELAYALKRHVELRIDELRERRQAERRKNELEGERIDATLPARACPSRHVP